MGSDDFCVSPLLAACCRVVSTVLVFAVWGTVSGSVPAGCTAHEAAEVYLIGAVSVNAAFAVEEIVLAHQSWRGGIMTPTARPHIPLLLSIRISLWSADILWTLFGTIVAAAFPSCFEGNPEYSAVIFILVMSWLMLASHAFFAYAVFLTDSAEKKTDRDVLYGKRWVRRLKRLLCLASPDAECLEEISELFANMFRSVDLVPTDILAGVILVQRSQQLREAAHEAKRTPKQDSSFIDLIAFRGHTVQSSTLGKRESANVHTPRADNTNANASPNSFQNARISGDFSTATDNISTHSPFRGQRWSRNSSPALSSANVTLTRLDFDIEKPRRLQQYPSSAMEEPLITPFESSKGVTAVKVVERLCLFLRYAQGAYGWPMFLLDRPCTGCCQLASSRTGLGKSFTGVLDCCACNEAALVRTLRGSGGGVCGSAPGRDVRVVHFSDTNTECCSPYSVVIDHDVSSVVIAVRGTLSVQDVVTDARASLCPVVLPISQTLLGTAHNGMFRTAKKIYDQTRSALAASFAKHPSYKLILTGHSLGAGVASILSCLLSEVYETHICLAFSPPGALGDEKVAAFAKKHVYSFVFGKDLVPRFSEASSEHLRNHIMAELAAHGEVSKMAILGSRLKALPERRTPSLAGNQALHKHTTTVAADVREQRVLCSCFGNVMHFLDDASQGPLAAWRRADDLQEIEISPRMFLDHFPHNNVRTAETVLRRLRGEELTQIPYTFAPVEDLLERLHASLFDATPIVQKAFQV